MSKEFKEIKAPSSIKYIKPGELTELEGTFLGVVMGEYGANYKFELEDGSEVVVNGCGALNKLMPEISEGTLVKLVNLGLEQAQKGPNKGKPFHNIKVFAA